MWKESRVCNFHNFHDKRVILDDGSPSTGAQGQHGSHGTDAASKMEDINTPNVPFTPHLIPPLHDIAQRQCRGSAAYTNIRSAGSLHGAEIVGYEQSHVSGLC